MGQLAKVGELGTTRTYSPTPREEYQCYVKLGYTRQMGRISLIFALISTILCVGALRPLWAQSANTPNIKLEIIEQIESGGNPLAFNKKSGATGAFQITEIALRDFNNEVGSRLTMKDMKKAEKAAHVAIWMFEERLPYFIKKYGLNDSELTRIAIWNWGVGNTVKWSKEGSEFNKLPKETRNFYEKYKRISGNKV